MPFPFVKAPRLRERPAIVVGAGMIGRPAALLWVLMVTSAANGGWPDDITLIERFPECGLTVPCVIRAAKVSTVEAARARKVGAVPADVLETIRETVARQLGI